MSFALISVYQKLHCTVGFPYCTQTTKNHQQEYPFLACAHDAEKSNDPEIKGQDKSYVSSRFGSCDFAAAPSNTCVWVGVRVHYLASSETPVRELSVVQQSTEGSTLVLVVSFSCLVSC